MTTTTLLTFPTVSTRPACASPTADSAWWFSDEPQEQKLAINICGSCTLRDSCLKGAVRRKEEFGIWGGVPASILRSHKTCRRGHDQVTSSIIIGGIRRCGTCYRMSQDAVRERRKLRRQERLSA